MKIKDQTRKLAAGCSKHLFEVVDKTDEVKEQTRKLAAGCLKTCF
ncbi:chlorohydrolase [Streptococcus pneumoniae]|nr:chlorohydrolase [Streptococcus pneumoniae]